MDGGASIDPPRVNHRRPLARPFWAMEVTPAITFPFRGLLTDSEARVLGHGGQPIPHLFAIGADGCFYRNSYFGGLALGLIFGMRAAEADIG
jgi:predicted oxidoreductase